MNVTINGSTLSLPDGATVATAVRTLTTAATGIAVAVNETVVSRGSWESTVLSEADRIEVLTAVQGG